MLSDKGTNRISCSPLLSRRGREEPEAGYQLGLLHRHLDGLARQVDVVQRRNRGEPRLIDDVGVELLIELCLLATRRLRDLLQEFGHGVVGVPEVVPQGGWGELVSTSIHAGMLVEKDSTKTGAPMRVSSPPLENDATETGFRVIPTCDRYCARMEIEGSGNLGSSGQGQLEAVRIPGVCKELLRLGRVVGVSLVQGVDPRIAGRVERLRRHLPVSGVERLEDGRAVERVIDGLPNPCVTERRRELPGPVLQDDALPLGGGARASDLLTSPGRPCRLWHT